MPTLMKRARDGEITESMEAVAKMEGLNSEFIRRGIANGRIIIPNSNRRELKSPIGIGEGLSVKINANIGSSKKEFDINKELEKAKIAVEYGADTLMDLSTGITEKDVIKIRQNIIEETDIPLGTVPIYQSALRAIEQKGAIVHMDENDLFSVVEEQAREGVDFFTVHAGITRDLVDYLVEHPRMMGVVSRGGTFHASWILTMRKKIPLTKILTIYLN